MLVNNDTTNRSWNAVKAGYYFARDNWYPLLPALLAYALSSSYAGALYYIDVEPVRQFLSMMICTLVSLSASAAMIRKAIRDETTGLAGLDFGPDELRLMAAGLFASLCALTIVFVFATVIFLLLILRLGDHNFADPDQVFAEMEMWFKTSEPVAMLSGVLMLICIGLIVWVGLRLSLYGVCTLGLRRIGVEASWQWTKGHAQSIFGSYLLPISGALILTMLATKIFHEPLINGRNDLLTAWMFSLPPSLLEAGLVLLFVGISTYFYHTLNPEGGPMTDQSFESDLANSPDSSDSPDSDS